MQTTRPFFILIAALFLMVSGSLKADILQLNRDNIQAVLNSPEPLIIDIYADWCGPCRSMAPIFQTLSQEYGQYYRFAKINGDKERQLVKQFNIRAYPTILFIKNGTVVARKVGFLNKNAFESLMQSSFN